MAPPGGRSQRSRHPRPARRLALDHRPDGNTSTTQTVRDEDTRTITRRTETSSGATSQQTSVAGKTVSARPVHLNSPIRYRHDSLGRQVGADHPRTGEIVTYYSDSGRIDRIVDPGERITGYLYDETTGRQNGVVHPDGSIDRIRHDLHGRRVASWGTSYPVTFGYDEFGSMETMHTFRSLTPEQAASLEELDLSLIHI